MRRFPSEVPLDAAVPSDEELAARVAAGSSEALQALHQRYAPLVFFVACKSLDRAAAEEIVQDVFLALWTKAGSFDAARGALKPWLLQIAHHRIVNELRTRSRRPQSEPGSPERLDELLAHDSAPDEAVWREYQRSAIHAALRALPAAQRQALAMAYFGDLSHEEVARSLQVPLGTAKTRIRAGLQKLAARLSMLAAVGLLLGLGAAYLGRNAARRDRALRMLTSSHAEALRLEPAHATGDPEQMQHATYRGERGLPTAVLTLSHFPPAPRGSHYELWRASGGAWMDLGPTEPGPEGRQMLVLERPELATWPEALRISLERDGVRPSQPAEAVVAWPR